LTFCWSSTPELDIDNDSCVISTFFVLSDYDNSACPEETWLEAMASHDLNKGYTGAVVINVGFNKGYNAGLFMSLFAPATKVSQVTWGNVVKTYYETHNVARDQFNCGYCGCCGDCKSDLKSDPQNYTLLNSSVHTSNNFVYVGIDLNNENVAMVNDIFSQLSSTFSIKPSNAIMKLIHAAGGEKTEIISIPKCATGDEICRIPDGNKNDGKSQNSNSVDKNIIDVLVVAVDDLVAELYSANVSHNTILTNFSIYQTRTHDNVYVNQDGNTPTIIDI
jgi:hypothetical protein